MKRLLTLTFLLCLGTFAGAQIPSYVPTNGLVGWWPFNGNANDESGNGNHGTVNGATLAADRNGNAGKAYSFDGNGDFISIPNSNSLTPPNITMNAWFSLGKPYSRGGSCILSKINHSWANYGGYYLLIDSLTLTAGYSQIGCSSGTGIGGYSTNKSFQSQIGNWQMFSVTISNSGTIYFYLNGVLIHQNQGASFSPCNNLLSELRFGHWWDGDNQWFNGLLDDIAIYNRALTAAEVQQLYLGACSQPMFTAQPQNKSVAQGQSTTFAVQVDTNSTFQWQMNLGLGAGWMNIPQSSLFSGDTTSMLSVQGRNPLDGAQFRCIATACQSDTSNAATLTVTSNSSTLGSVAGVPGKINYQGAAVDSLGKPMKNQTIVLKLSVLDSSSSGAAVYVETHSTPTNGSGLFSLQIGGGTAVTGTFDSIPWANGRNKYLKTEVQQNGTWVNLGTSQLVSVPYALVSGKAMEATTASFLRDNSGNAYQLQTVNGQPTLVSAPGNVSAPGAFACGQALTYAGESYPTVQIGSQCWFQKNVNAGSMVLGANDQTNNGILEKYCYNNDTANCSIYGGLYQWAEAVQYQNGATNTTSPNPAFTGNLRGICPTGWHLPSDAEYCTLTTFLDATANCSVFGTSSSIAGGMLKSTSGLWSSPNTGATNSSGFSALPGGFRDTNVTFYSIVFNTYFWSSSESSSTNAITRHLSHLNSNIYRFNNYKNGGFSARCLKD
jgi:uncharacterized protein (TIGR02145 family)